MSLIKKIKYLWAIPGAASGWVKSLDLCSKGSFKEALQLLQKIELMQAGRNVEYHLLRGFAFCKVGEYEHAIDDARMAMQLIPSDTQYNNEEKKYLYAHAQITWARALQDEGKQSESDQILLQCDIPSIKLNKVCKSIKLNFPFKAHPNWEKDMGKD
ncbi:tetratricopeptide repeat protein [Mariprofundus ferrooxydans]|nr:hypothetical protein [Mariprofundus ferrooxydans]